MIVYGRNPVREALRGRRKVKRAWATARAIDSEPWLREAGAAVASGDQIEQICGTADHQGVCAEAGPYPYVDLGAVSRVAESVGAAGIVIPERRSAEVTPAACKASAGAVEHLPIARVANLANWLGEAKDAGAWIYGAEAGEGSVAYGSPDYDGRVVLVLGSEGRGLRARVAATCDQLVALPQRGRVNSLNVSTAAAALLYGILQARLDKQA